MKRSILIVDDEFGLAEILAEILGDLGYDVRLAANGKLGLESIAERRPDLVLLDFMMPILDGRAVLKILKADPVLSRIPVVMMSAVPDLLRQEPMPDAALVKPFHPKDMLSVVARLLASD